MSIEFMYTYIELKSEKESPQRYAAMCRNCSGVSTFTENDIVIHNYDNKPGTIICPKCGKEICISYETYTKFRKKKVRKLCSNIKVISDDDYHQMKRYKDDEFHYSFF